MLDYLKNYDYLELVIKNYSLVVHLTVICTRVQRISVLRNSSLKISLVINQNSKLY